MWPTPSHPVSCTVIAHSACPAQVIAVGDFNIAAEPRDVHSAISWDTLYAESELQALQQLIKTLDDSWRRLHPQQEGVYTVWDEKTSARAFNVVSHAGT